MVTVVTDKQEFQPGSAENWPNLAIAMCCRTMQIIRLFVWIVAFRIFFLWYHISFNSRLEKVLKDIAGLCKT